MKRNRLTGLLALILVLASLVFLAIYIHSTYLFDGRVLPEMFFWGFAITFSVALMLLWALNVNEKLILFAIFVSAAVIVSIPFLRFYFYGADFVGEYFVADSTRELGRWTPEMVTGSIAKLDWSFNGKPTELLHRYFSATSVTILPAVISEITGASMILVFWLMIIAVSTATVMVGYLIVKMCFGQKIAALSSIIYVFSSFYMSKFATILREDVALFFLLLTVLYVLKGGRKSLVICLISLVLIPMSHYGLVYFAFLLLFLLFVSKKVYQNKLFKKILAKLGANVSYDFEKPLVSGSLILFSVFVSLSWLLFVAYPVFASNVGGFVESLEALLGLTSTRLSYFQQYVVFSSLGMSHTIVKWLERITAVVGLLLALRLSKDHKTFSFVFASAGLFAAALAITFLPNLGTLFDLDRMMQVALLGFSTLMAIFIFTAFQKGKIGKIFSFIFVTLILLDSIQIPILYSSATNLSREEYIFSFTHEFTFYEPSDFQFVKWAEKFTNGSAVFASDSIGYGLCLIAKRICVQPWGIDVQDTISLLKRGKTDYFLYVFYLPDYMAFYSKKGELLEFNSTEISSLIDSSRLNRIYDNSRVVNFGYVG